MKNNSKRKNLIVIWLITIALVGIMGLLMFFFVNYVNSFGKSDNGKTYDRYYVMISDDPSSSLCRSVYDAQVEAGKKVNAYVEMLSDRVSSDYSKYELMEIAIASDVDGIIVDADETDEMRSLITQAKKNGIPVVTIFSDNANSDRISFVGVGNYNIGAEYGAMVADISEAKKGESDSISAVVLVDSNSNTSGQNVLYAAIQETLENDLKEHPYTHVPVELSIFSVDATNNFTVEKSVRELLQRRKELPDVVVCLTEIDTTSVYQAVVDLNEVGNVNILGYYDSEAILKAIDKNVIYSTISVDASQLGHFSIDALTEYYELGNTSQYFPADISIISKKNVAEYLKEGDTDEK